MVRKRPTFLGTKRAFSAARGLTLYLYEEIRLDYIRLDNFRVPLQYMGNSGWFLRGKRAAIMRRYTQLCFSLSFLCEVFSCFYTYQRL